MTLLEPSSFPESLTFAELGLNTALLKALPTRLKHPTRAQQLAIPAILAGRDLLALAQTGSGKTLAFGLPLLQQLLLQQQTQLQRTKSVPPQNALALVLVPTRELALQVTEALRAIASQLSVSAPLHIQLLCGGVALEEQLAELTAKPQLLVATPGRLLDLCKQSHISLDSIKHLVLDEADRLLEMGFWPDVQKLMAFMPKLKQSSLFSATLLSLIHI